MILALLQARMASTRLPGKVMMPLLGIPMILQQWRRITRSTGINVFAVATSSAPSDDVLAEFCQAHGMAVFRGAHNDVLARFVAAAHEYPAARHIVRLTADCPLADPEVIDACVALHIQEAADYTSNCIRRTFPKGLDVEVMTRETLARLHQVATTREEREHVTLHVYRNPDSFRIASLSQAADASAMRWTVDTPADFRFVEQIYAALFPSNPMFSRHDVHALLSARPELSAALQQGH